MNNPTLALFFLSRMQKSNIEVLFFFVHLFCLKLLSCSFCYHNNSLFIISYIFILVQTISLTPFISFWRFFWVIGRSWENYCWLFTHFLVVERSYILFSLCPIYASLQVDLSFSSFFQDFILFSWFLFHTSCVILFLVFLDNSPNSFFQCFHFDGTFFFFI